jgi:hypothetical protein
MIPKIAEKVSFLTRRMVEVRQNIDDWLENSLLRDFIWLKNP